MSRWRRIAVGLLLALVGVPLAMPFVELFTQNTTDSTRHSLFTDYPQRLLFLGGNTLFLVAGTLTLAIPFGTAAAALLYRTDLPGRHWLRFLVVLSLFVPLPVLTTAWQAALASVGLWTTAGMRWAEGLEPAIWIHALAALPWVILIVGQGLLCVEPELEEDALLAAPPRRVLWRVTLPRCRGAIVAAAIWVALQASSEIAVTDLMRVDTLAREVYNEFTLGGSNALARALAISLPLIVFGSVALLWGLIKLERILPPLIAPLAEPRPFPLGVNRWPCFAIVCLSFGLFVSVPFASLVWKTGLVGYPGEWSFEVLINEVAVMAHAEAGLIGKSLITMFLAAGLIACVAMILCWLALDAPRFRLVLFGLMAVAWIIPGPIVGLGLKETIAIVIDWMPLRPLANVLYYEPSPLPVLWAYLLHFLPCAVAACWPVMKLLPRELRESLQLDGATPSQELRYLVWPQLRKSWLAAVIIVAALALGEVGAVAMRVETPDWTMFAHVLFDRMHFGQPRDVTALCLVLLFMVGFGGGLTGILIARRRAKTR
jgi:iron(III) transport system permease protein